MRRFIPRISAMALAVAAAVPYAQADIIDKIAATVDTEVILYSEILIEARPALEQLRMSQESEETMTLRAESIIRDTLEQAVKSKILLREARLVGITVEDAEIDERINNLKGTGEATEQFLKELDAAGENLNDVRERLRKITLAQRLSASKMHALENEVVVTEAEIVDFYNEHRDRYSVNERVLVRQIFLAADTAEGRTQARARLEALKDEMEAGASFEELAVAHSQAPGAENGGTLGWQEHGSLIPELEQVAFSLPVGEVSGIVESPFGVHVLRVDEHQDAGAASLEDVRATIEPELRKQAAIERYDLWINELRKRSRVRIFI